MTIPSGDRSRFILENTTVLVSPHVPEIKLHLADEAHDLWHKTEEELEQEGLQPPFWAFAWAGGQGLARHVLDHPDLVRNRRVLDFASGSGIVAIAAKMAGGYTVTANDIDPFCKTAIELNANLNGVNLKFSQTDLLATGHQWFEDIDILLAGDVFYDRAMAVAVLPMLQAFAASGKSVLIGDPGRAYLPKTGLALKASHEVPVTRMLEDAEVKHTSIWQVIAS